jgi:hypothetical protein
MKSLSQITFKPARMNKQRGVVLFFALICLLAIMLAAVALVRSVDTNTIIAGNLALQQAATRSGDVGTEAAMKWLMTVKNSNSGKNVLTDPNHPFNQNDATNGYYASIDPLKGLTAPLTLPATSLFNWNDNDSSDAIVDGSGNSTRYIIQRMCRTAGVAAKDADCLYAGEIESGDGQHIPTPPEICKSDVGGCPPLAGQKPQIRITSRTTGPKNTLSYVQTFVY